MTRRDWTLLIALSTLWGGSYLFIRVAVVEIPPLTLVFGRTLIAGLALGAVMAASGEALPRGRAVWGVLAAMSLFNVMAPFSLIMWGATQISAGLAAILNATTPLFTLLVAHFATADERLTPAKAAGVGLGVAGVAAMIGPAAWAGLDAAILAQFACLGAALSYGVANIWGRRLKPFGLTPLQSAFGMLAVCALVMLPVSAAIDRPWAMPAPSATALGAMAALALLSTAVAYLLFFRILASAGGVNLSLVTFLIPVSATLLGAVALGERLAPRHAAGMALIGLGLAAIDGRIAARLRRSGGQGTA